MSYKKKRSPEQKKLYVHRVVKHLISERKTIAFERRRLESFEKRSRLCGKPIFRGTKSPIGYCNKASCDRCNRRWAGRRSGFFIRKCEDQDWINFRLLTIMLPVQRTIEDCFEVFEKFKLRFPKSVIKARDLKKDLVLRDQWRAFHLTGGLEIDSFSADEFDKLGEKKEQDLIRDHQFDRERFQDGSIYLPHIHCAIYIGDLDDRCVHDRLKNFCVNSHTKMLHTDKNISKSIEDILDYPGKMEFLTTLDKNKRVDWNDEAMVEYMDAIVGKQGKRSFSISISKYQENKEVRKQGLLNNVYNSHTDLIP